MLICKSLCVRMCTHSLLYVCTHAYTQIHKISECQSWTLSWSLLLPILFWKPFLTSGHSLFCEELSVVWGGSRQQDTCDGWTTLSLTSWDLPPEAVPTAPGVFPAAGSREAPLLPLHALKRHWHECPQHLLSAEAPASFRTGPRHSSSSGIQSGWCSVLGNLKRRYSEASSKIAPRRQKYPLSAPRGLKSDYWEVVSRMRVATKFLS